jgi:hypothetical protein
LKPVLLSYHAGELHFDWKTKFQEEVVKQKIVRLQDINWAEMKEKFPNQTTISMSHCLTRFSSQKHPGVIVIKLFFCLSRFRTIG